MARLGRQLSGKCLQHKCEEQSLNLQNLHKSEHDGRCGTRCAKGNQEGAQLSPGNLKGRIARTHSSEQQESLSQRLWRVGSIT